MALSKKDKLQVMAWAVELAKLEFESQHNKLGSDTFRTERMLAGMKKYEGEVKPDPMFNPVPIETITISIYKNLLHSLKK